MTGPSVLEKWLKTKHRGTRYGVRRQDIHQAVQIHYVDEWTKARRLTKVAQSRLLAMYFSTPIAHVAPKDALRQDPPPPTEALRDLLTPAPVTCNRASEPGWRLFARPHGRRGLLMRDIPGGIELCAGREGDDAHVSSDWWDALDNEDRAQCRRTARAAIAAYESARGR